MEHRYFYFDKKLLGEKYYPIKTKEIEITNVMDLGIWASENWYSYYMIKRLNPRIITNKLQWNWHIQIL